MKNNLFKFLLFAIGTIAMNTSCESQTEISQCIKGKYVGTYCDGHVIQILDQSTIGKNWNNHFGIQYTNCVLASVDSIYSKSIIESKQFFSKDSVFYFKFINGGYPLKAYINCEPTPFITITYLSVNP